MISFIPSRNPFLHIGASLLLCMNLAAAILEVGPEKKFRRIEDAVGAAQPGDVINVDPLPKNAPYTKVAVVIATPRLTIMGLSGPKGEAVRLSGENFDYSGEGKIPRAIFQIQPEANEVTIEGFDIFGASNTSHNGAGVRINQANRVTIRHCEIHHNEMGIMSNGDIQAASGAEQLIEFCKIHHNGSSKEPGFSHNLYLGGTGVRVQGCEIYASITGHNLKSRCHFNRIESCFIHDSANREIDLVDDEKNTAVPNSHSILIGNLIVKQREMTGNKTVIHFGQDGKKPHLGTLYMIHNTIITPFSSPVVDLSTQGTAIEFTNNLFWDWGNGANHPLVSVRDGGSLLHVKGHKNWLGAGFSLPLVLDPEQNYFAKKTEIPEFSNFEQGDWSLKGDGTTKLVGMGMPWAEILLPASDGMSEATALKKLFQYRSANSTEMRNDALTPDIGAFKAP